MPENYELGFCFNESLPLSIVQQICGVQNTHIKMIENALSVRILHKGHSFTIVSESDLNIHKTKQLLELIKKDMLSKFKNDLDESDMHNYLNPAHLETLNHKEDEDLSINKSRIDKNKENASKPPKEESQIKTPKMSIITRTPVQNAYVNGLRNLTVSFGIGPAGTGKTFLAIALAVEAILQQKVDKIILVRPAVEAGEKLGFLPGDMTQKIDPYLRPLFDSLHATIGVEQVNKWQEEQKLEIAPLAFMRGRTLSKSFIVLDEAQNTSISQMKMFLTRIGFSSIVAVTGDPTQTDLSCDEKSGLIHAQNTLFGIDDIGFFTFSEKDVRRHELVRKILSAYNKN